MAYNKELARRFNATFGNIPIVEKKMFEGIGYLLHRNTPALASQVQVWSAAFLTTPSSFGSGKKITKQLSSVHARAFSTRLGAQCVAEA